MWAREHVLSGGRMRQYNGDSGNITHRYNGAEGPTDLFLVVEADLADSHAAVLFEVRPWCVNNCHVVFLVAYSAVVSLSWLLVVAGKLRRQRDRGRIVFTFNGVRLCQLCAVFQQVLGYIVP